MSTSTDAAPTHVDASPDPDGSRFASRWWRHRGTVGLLAAFVLLVAGVALTAGDPTTTARLDPANPGPDGARAVYRVLARDGVQTEVVRDEAAFAATSIDGGTTVVVSSTADLGRSTVASLREHAAPGHLVLLEPSGGVWNLLGAGYASTTTPAEAVRADCSATAAAGAVVGDLEVVVDRATTYPGPGCFAGDDGRPSLVDAGGALVVGAGEALTNASVLRGDDAALALRLLGQQDRLVWYVANAQDLAADDAVSIGSLLPDWIGPGLGLGALVMIAVIVWRGRRLGALATEPLPVVVRAVETTHSRGRLYRRAGDRAHASRTLRAAARTRLGERIGLGAAEDPDALMRSVATRTGRDPREITALLSPDATHPTTDHDLITLAQELDRLDREVRDT